MVRRSTQPPKNSLRSRRHQRTISSTPQKRGSVTIGRPLFFGIVVVVSALGLVTVFLLSSPSVNKPTALQQRVSSSTSAMESLNAMKSTAADAKTETREPLQPSRLQLPRAAIEFNTEAEQRRLLGEVEDAVRSYPDDAVVAFIGGSTYKELLQTERASELFKRTMALDASNAEAVVALAGLLTQAGQHDEALELLSKAEARGTSSASLLTALGTAYSETGNAESAVVSLEKALSRDPASSSTHLHLAQALIELQRFEAAEQHARVALQLAPSSRAASIALSSALMKQDKKEAALHVRAEMAKIKAQDAPEEAQYKLTFRDFAADIYTKLGAAYATHDALQAAERCLIRALELQPALATSAIQLADLFRREGRLRDGMAVYERLVEIQPENPMNFHNLASLAVSTGDIELAEKTLRSAAEVDTSGKADLQLARFLLGVGKLPESAAQAQLAVDRLGSVDAFLVLIASHRARGDKPAALAAYVKAKSIAPNDPRLATFAP